MEDISQYYTNIDELPQHLPDLPTCYCCGAAWTDLVKTTPPEIEPIAVLVVCFSGHAQWFGYTHGDWQWLAEA